MHYHHPWKQQYYWNIIIIKTLSATLKPYQHYLNISNFETKSTTSNHYQHYWNIISNIVTSLELLKNYQHYWNIISIIETLSVKTNKSLLLVQCPCYKNRELCPLKKTTENFIIRELAWPAAPFIIRHSRVKLFKFRKSLQ